MKRKKTTGYAKLCYSEFYALRIQYLAKHNDGFRGKSDVIFTKNNGKFLGFVEMLSKFDSVAMEHVRRIKNEETHTHYMRHDIQDELINLMANEVKKKIIKEIQQCKYFSIIMDCTPDTSRKEQLSIIIRTVNMIENDDFSEPKIKEYFLDFIIVESTTGLNLANVVLDKLNEYGIQISNCRGQSYDNGANMIGQYQGVQSRILQQNSRAFFMPCASHNLNLLLRDTAKSSVKAITFFGTIERVYTIFSASTSRWAILNKHCHIITN